MQMKRLGDERAKRKGFENVFTRFDKNKNGKNRLGWSTFILIPHCSRFNVRKRFFERDRKIEHQNRARGTGRDQQNIRFNGKGISQHKLPSTNYHASRSRKQNLRSTRTTLRFTRRWTKIVTGRLLRMSWIVRPSWPLRWTAVTKFKQSHYWKPLMSVVSNNWINTNQNSRTNIYNFQAAVNCINCYGIICCEMLLLIGILSLNIPWICKSTSILLHSLIICDQGHLVFLLSM